MFAESCCEKTVYAVSVFSNRRSPWNCIDKTSCPCRHLWLRCITVKTRSMFAAGSDWSRYLIFHTQGPVRSWKKNQVESLIRKKYNSKKILLEMSPPAWCRTVYIRGEQFCLSIYTFMRFVPFYHWRICLWFIILPSCKPKLNMAASTILIPKVSWIEASVKAEMRMTPEWGFQESEELQNFEFLCIPQRTSVQSLAHAMESVVRGDAVYLLEAPWALQPRPKLRHLFSIILRRMVQPDFIARDPFPVFILAWEDGVLRQVASKLDHLLYSFSTSSVILFLCALYYLVSNFRAKGLFGGLWLYVRIIPVTFSRAHKRAAAFKFATGASFSSWAIYPVHTLTGKVLRPSILHGLSRSMECMYTTSPTELAIQYIIQDVRD